jgi:uncharacterized protein
MRHMRQPASTPPLALVTGASAGIGRAFAKRLALEGYEVTLVARTKSTLSELASELRVLGGHCGVLPADLTAPAERNRVEQQLRERPYDLLVNAAGFGTMGRFETLDPEREEAEIALNALALTRLCRAVLPGMVSRRRGFIINVSSIGAFYPCAYNATYGATKAYVNSLTEAIATELEGTGVRMLALCPGFTRTEFHRRASVNVSDIPGPFWALPDQVVSSALDALGKSAAIYVPGWKNRLLLASSKLLPKKLTVGLTARVLRAHAPANDKEVPEVQDAGAQT